MDGLLALVEGAVTTPWIYLALFALAALDSVVPVAPGESLVVTAAVFSATGAPEPLLVVAAAALGAFVGDHASYLVGRSASGSLERWMRPGTRQGAAFAWAGRTLQGRGGVILLASRYVPGARTATTLTMGATGYPLQRFTAFDAGGALLWGGGWTLIGYLGGQAFGDDPLLGLAAGLGMAAAMTVLAEVARRLWGRRARRRGTAAPDEAVDPAG
ncbi:DedA family protein [Allostreptomyces psammosilenae]|uniref:Membrane protein DedA with SNARE-associated domain n=1 Tax=Allostreptomyces psammosilenae TaxID=1892865 RepID=A0A853A1J9_9ACTN|nr:VTT domain-containing protein [Allostreptomyces psammosilenae]NYI08285.1 membrane protein DedA with SNARE-associated domain [Allostreptomyces psammosilenae]